MKKFIIITLLTFNAAIKGAVIVSTADVNAHDFSEFLHRLLPKTREELQYLACDKINCRMSDLGHTILYQCDIITNPAVTCSICLTNNQQNINSIRIHSVDVRDWNNPDIAVMYFAENDHFSISRVINSDYYKNQPKDPHLTYDAVKRFIQHHHPEIFANQAPETVSSAQ